jgi:hypothetical protein
MTTYDRAVPVGRLAILVVYHVTDDADLPLVALHLERVARHTSTPYAHYAVTARATPAARALVAAAPNVQVCEVEPTAWRGSREHAYYLDAMRERALADGATHVVTLDLDSFPIEDRWLDTLTAAAPAESGLAAILRTENGDVALPHPSCCLVGRDFLERYDPSFSPDWDGTPEFRRFLHTTGQAGDTGIRFAYVLWSHHLAWGALRRSNAVDVHPVIAGIYADVVFHLGASSRGTIFRYDLVRSPVHRLTTPLERYPARRDRTKRMKRRALDRLRGPAERRLIDRNRVVSTAVREWLLADATDLFDFLRGRPPAAGTAERDRFLAALGPAVAR